MRSLYFKNFISTAALVILSFSIIGSAFVFIGRSYVISAHRDNMQMNAQEVVKAASALTEDGDLNSWNLRIAISSMAYSSGNHIFITDETGVVISCSDMDVACPHIGKRIGS